MSDALATELADHIRVMEATARDNAAVIDDIATALVTCFKAGKKLLLFGNGGSAADAQHIAAEFVNRFSFDRPPLPAIALTTDSSVLTSIGNDSAYEFTFARQVECIAQAGDVVVGISTSGGSANVLRGLEEARKRGAVCVGFTGERGRASMGERSDHCVVVPTKETARIQEGHAFVLHVVSGIVESQIFTRPVAK